jgi:hypothetical protein
MHRSDRTERIPYREREEGPDGTAFHAVRARAAARRRRDAARATARIGTRRRVGRPWPPGCASERGGGGGGGKGVGVKSAGESGSRGGGSREGDG